MNKKTKIQILKEELGAVIVAHFYQRDEIVDIADIIGDSLELAKKSKESDKELVIFCGVGFMGQSVKILAPQKRVFMPKNACCSMARMIDSSYFDQSIAALESYGIPRNNILPVSYINSSAEVKAKVGEMDGFICTSANATTIMQYAQKESKKIFFLPDRCLGQNLAIQNHQSAATLGLDSKEDILKADIICYNGFCSVHQLFTPEDVDFYRQKFPDILVAVHPECDPKVCMKADFVGSTSQIIRFVQSLNPEQKVVVGTEFNLVNRLRKKNTYVLSASKPECPTMNETTLDDVIFTLESYKKGDYFHEILLNETIRAQAFKALDKMLNI
ncbi:quinolinate synthetase [Helicobacter monodelphidis]|uniref:quinolinate synthase NadA n=1 Tax=Helicobacter sp. 15-1451 TaxID=2004995 RepID=UPI000DCF4C81|nr:quinolinate synthase NadA [Helicobacter sp. 15-1451]RAX56724.1 quinolinate synthetase [Helicobacter sp. 15-1451]